MNNLEKEINDLKDFKIEIEAEMKQMMDLIEDEKKKYQERVKSHEKSQKVVVAWVIFKSEIWQQRALKIFELSRVDYYKYKLVKCFC